MSLKMVKFPVLDDGFVTLVDYMGDDAAVVQAARVSYGEGTKTVHEDRGLIRHLLRNWHTTPFEMVEFKFLVRVPMDAWRQWIRHRMASVNEYSTRYSIAIDSAQKTPPDEWRSQSKTNKQGSGNFLHEYPEGFVPTEKYDNGEPIPPDSMYPGDYLTMQEERLQKYARHVYEERVALGMAREQARKDLPLSTYTEAYWKIDLHNLLNFLRLRMDSHAQKEIRDYAVVIGQNIVSQICPLVWEAFTDYRLNSVTITKQEFEMLAAIKATGLPVAKPENMAKSEFTEFQAKVAKLGL